MGLRLGVGSRIQALNDDRGGRVYYRTQAGI